MADTNHPKEDVQPSGDRELTDQGDLLQETAAKGVASPGSRTRWWLVIAMLAAFLGVGAWLVLSRLPDLLTQSEVTDKTTAIDTAAAAAGGGRRIQATLFYVSDDGLALTGTVRDVLFGATPVEQARRIVEAQVQTPEGVVSAIPTGTIVRAVFLTDDHQAYVDLGGTIVSGHSGGSLDEALAVYAIVNAITVNMPDVTGVQILIEGKEVDTLAGHVDLRFPLPKATVWIQKGHPETQ
jgi:hypothetical protein